MEDWQERMRRWKERAEAYGKAHPKETAETSLLILLLLFAGAWWLPGDETEGALTVTQQEAKPPAKEQRTPPRIEVKGAAQASEDKPLTNPFSFAHEERSAMQPQPAGKREEQTAKSAEASLDKRKENKTQAAAAAKADISKAGKPETPQEPELALVLKGVAQSETQTIAVIDAGGREQLVRTGEAIGGFTLIAVDHDSATLESDTETRVLRLPVH